MTRASTKELLLFTRDKVLEDELMYAWTIIANAGGGDWNKESPDWRKAACRFRENVHKLVDHTARCALARRRIRR